MTVFLYPSDDPKNAVITIRQYSARCCIGAGGVSLDKIEGDNCTPIGLWPLRRVFFRPDKITIDNSKLQSVALTHKMAWSDDPRDKNNYNSLVELPYNYSHEALWRNDDLYDIIIEVGYNDQPVIANRGSAIFIHVAKNDFQPTAGCIGMKKSDLLFLLTLLSHSENINVKEVSPFHKTPV